MYSPAAWPPCQAKMTPVKATPMLIHTADSMAASFVVGTWGRRCTSSRSPTSSTVTKARNTTHTHTGTSKLAKLPSDDDCSDARTANDTGGLPPAAYHGDQPKVSPAARAVPTGPAAVVTMWHVGATPPRCVHPTGDDRPHPASTQPGPR